ncbi:hypothetical protein LB504_002968 [Fusarium proliferatum]|nr:hypothetical protein LB504_002968 [Fusarium proliferatum]
MASGSTSGQPLATSRDPQRVVTIDQPGTDMISSALPEHVGVAGSDESAVGNFQEATERRSATFDEAISDEPHGGILSTEGFDFLELGDMYHDSTFDFMHFNVTGDPQSPGSFRDSSLVPGQDDNASLQIPFKNYLAPNQQEVTVKKHLRQAVIPQKLTVYALLGAWD